jgi:methylthioribose-1-phosphate isomerase
MKNLVSTGIRHENKQLWVLDQQKLPQEEIWLPVPDVNTMVFIIKTLKIRGAPLLGVAAALTLAHLAETGANLVTLQHAAMLLKSARPTAVNLMHCVDRMMQVLNENIDNTNRFIAEAENIFDEDVKLCQAMGKHGASLINDGDSILTICNTGGLATAGIGTAFAAFKTAHEQGKRIHVYACETRPLLQGGRLTTWELEKAGIPHTLICDSMAGMLMAQHKIQKVFVGSDRIAANGDFANKIGTYNLAVLAKFHHIPFYPVAPYTTFDRNCPNGDAIVIEQRDPDEVLGVAGSFGKVTWAPIHTKVYNPAFDVTPVNLVTNFVSDKGVGMFD